MKNTVSFETASRLKAAGFPQPEPEFGQVYFDVDGDRLICLEENFFFEKGLDAPSWISDNRASRLVFAPTPSDIFLSIGVTPFLYSANGDEMMFSILTNPERAASFWIGFNKRKHDTRMVRGSQ